MLPCCSRPIAAVIPTRLVYAKLESPECFPGVQGCADQLIRGLNVKPMREADYYSSQSEMLYKLVTGLGTLIAVIMGLGAVFGALNTMYTAVSVTIP